MYKSFDFPDDWISIQNFFHLETEKSVIRKVLNGGVQLVYITPENAIDNPLYRNMLISEKYKENLVALVIDEAHCTKLWGDLFRKAFSMIGNLRILVPCSVNVMALTATATTETYHCALKCLSINDHVLIALSPDRGNTRYIVHPSANIEELSELLHVELSYTGKKILMTVVFVRKYSHCSDLYILLEHKLGRSITNAPGYPNVSKYRRVEMYSRIMSTEKKVQVLSNFSSKNDSTIEMIISTSAFGLGVDCSDIRTIIHWGLPTTIEEYVQEAGRAGRDGIRAEAILFEGKTGKFCEKKMRDYQSTIEICRHRYIFQDFLCFHTKYIT